MKKIFLLALIAAATVYAYYWYVRGINLLIRGDEVSLPPYAVAQRLPPKSKPKDAAPAEEVLRWEAAIPMPTPRSEVGAAAIGSRIYVVGGIDGFARTLSTVELFDTELNLWTSVRSLPKPVHHAAVAATGGKLYVFGGFTGIGATPVDSLYVYDPLTDRWTRGADLPRALGASAVVVVDGKIHLLGGKSLGIDVDSHYAYDPVEDTWENLPEMIAGREQSGALYLDGKIFVFGGRQGGALYNLDAVEIYDVARKAWDPGANMPLKRSGFVALEKGGKAYLFGGEGPTVTFDQVDVYDPKLDRWTTMAEPMPDGRHGLGGAVVNGSFFLIGGGRRAGLSVSELNEVLRPTVAP